MEGPVKCWALPDPFAAFADRETARGASLDHEEPAEGVWVPLEEWARLQGQARENREKP